MASARQQRHRLEERQSHHVGIGSAEEPPEPRGEALDRIAAGLALPIARGQVLVELDTLEPAERDDGIRASRDTRAVGRDNRDTAENMVPPPREQLEATPRGLG